MRKLVAGIALVGLLTMVGAAVADNYASGLESPDFSTTWTGPGGTSDFVERARAMGATVAIVDPADGRLVTAT